MNFVEVQIVHVDFLVLVEKPMQNNTRQLVLNGGDIHRIVLVKPAILLALQRLSVEARVQSTFPPLNKGGIDCR
jgi:hypothetical protein